MNTLNKVKDSDTISKINLGRGIFAPKLGLQYGESKTGYSAAAGWTSAPGSF